MSDTGAVIIASNSKTTDGDIIDYVGLAKHSGQLIKRHLGIPVCLLTTDDCDHTGFDYVMKLDARPSTRRSMLNGQNVVVYDWKNDYRIEAFALSPFSKTLLLDADYLVLGDTLKPLLGSDEPFSIIDKVHDITGRNIYQNMTRMPDHTIRMRWATVMCFDSRAKPVFEAARMVRNDYEYYASMFRFSKQPYRNDYAFSIASHILGVPRSPVVMHQLPADCSIEADAGLRVTWGNNVLRWKSDLHVLNKHIAMRPSILEPLNG